MVLEDSPTGFGRVKALSNSLANCSAGLVVGGTPSVSDQCRGGDLSDLNFVMCCASEMGP